MSVGDVSLSAQKIWNSRFFIQSFLIIVVIHPGLTDLLRVLWPDSLRGQLVTADIHLFFSFLLPPKLASDSLFNFTSP